MNYAKPKEYECNKLEQIQNIVGYRPPTFGAPCFQTQTHKAKRNYLRPVKQIYMEGLSIR